MNSLLMKEVLKDNVDRKDFCDLVGPEVSTLFLNTVYIFFVVKKNTDT